MNDPGLVVLPTHRCVPAGRVDAGKACLVLGIDHAAADEETEGLERLVARFLRCARPDGDHAGGAWDRDRRGRHDVRRGRNRPREPSEPNL